MHPTPASLLERLRQPDDQDAWAEFVQLYTPLLYHWARRLHLAHQDAADLVQDVFTLLVRKLPGFTYDRHKRFRGWLWTLTLNQWRARRRHAATPGQQSTGDLAGLVGSEDVEQVVETEYRQYLVGRALKLMQTEFQPTTWKAFWECVVFDKSAGQVAAELGLSLDAVYAAKSRVLRRLRQELEGLLD